MRFRRPSKPPPDAPAEGFLERAKEYGEIADKARHERRAAREKARQERDAKKNDENSAR